MPWLHLRDGGEGAPEDEGDGHGRDGGVGIASHRPPQALHGD
jgi:hypothetical protein